MNEQVSIHLARVTKPFAKRFGRGISIDLVCKENMNVTSAKYEVMNGIRYVFVKQNTTSIKTVEIASSETSINIKRYQAYGRVGNEFGLHVFYYT